jgi:hypothetical protein
MENKKRPIVSAAVVFVQSLAKAVFGGIFVACLRPSQGF